jgi:2-polyprenyl-3-methyl-5-hydroxy-6-metoxy-1,4-benzoquinol methylase
MIERCIKTLAGVACTSRKAGIKNGHVVNACRACKHAFVASTLCPSDLADYYQGLREKSTYAQDLLKQDKPGSRSDAHKYISIISKILKSQSVSFLEVGSGWGYASELAYYLGWNITAIEQSLQCVDSLKLRIGLNSNIILTSFEEFSLPIGKKFDAILMSQVLEHAIDPASWLIKAKELLRPGGVLIVAVPQYRGFYGFLGLRDPFISPPEHLNFFSRKSLLMIAQSVGLRRLHVSGYSRIPYYNILARVKSCYSAMSVDLIARFVCGVADLIGLSMVQVQVFEVA